jgi:hypothetical protein
MFLLIFSAPLGWAAAFAPLVDKLSRQHQGCPKRSGAYCAIFNVTALSPAPGAQRLGRE